MICIYLCPSEGRVQDFALPPMVLSFSCKYSFTENTFYFANIMGWLREAIGFLSQHVVYSFQIADDENLLAEKTLILENWSIFG